LEEQVDRLANFKIDLCMKIDQVLDELRKLKKGIFGAATLCLYVNAG